VKKIIISFLFPAVLYSCNNKPEAEKKPVANDDSSKVLSKADTGFSANNYFKFIGDSVVLPTFEIDLQLSPKAEQKLKSAKETVIVKAYFSGVPKDTTSKAYKKWGEIGMLEPEIELSDLRTAKFDGVKFSKKLYDSIANKNLRLLINIYSGRRSSKDNLLNCDILEDSLSNIKDKKFVLKGKLIGE
jgi:hypothetical protein